MIDVQKVTLLQRIREQTIKKVDDLDEAFLIMEEDHKKFRDRENQVLAAKQRLEAIGNDNSLSDRGKLSAIKTLDAEVGSKTMHRAATMTQDEDVSAKADDSLYLNIGSNQVDKTVSINNSTDSLNF